MSDFWGPVAIVFVVIMAFIWGMMSLGRASVFKACDIFAEESGRTTKVVNYGYGSYDCLTLQESGKWISTKMLREEE